MKTLEVGEALQVGSWRLHRFEGVLTAQHLEGAGKRGKRCAKLSIDTPRRSEDSGASATIIAAGMISLVLDGGGVQEMEDFMRCNVAARCTFHKTELRGVDVCALEKIEIDGENIFVTCDGLEFSISCKRDQSNCPALYSDNAKGGKAFYALVSANREAIAGMTFSGIAKLLRDNGIDYRRACLN